MQVPKAFKMLQKELEEHKQKKPYLWWREYQEIGNAMGIKQSTYLSRHHFFDGKKQE